MNPPTQVLECETRQKTRLQNYQAINDFPKKY